MTPKEELKNIINAMRFKVLTPHHLFCGVSLWVLIITWWVVFISLFFL